jgi:hypothetical protein
MFDYQRVYPNYCPIIPLISIPLITIHISPIHINPIDIRFINLIFAIPNCTTKYVAMELIAMLAQTRLSGGSYWVRD